MHIAVIVLIAVTLGYYTSILQTITTCIINLQYNISDISQHLFETTSNELISHVSKETHLAQYNAFVSSSDIFNINVTSSHCAKIRKSIPGTKLKTHLFSRSGTKSLLGYDPVAVVWYYEHKVTFSYVDKYILVTVNEFYLGKPSKEGNLGDGGMLSEEGNLSDGRKPRDGGKPDNRGKSSDGGEPNGGTKVSDKRKMNATGKMTDEGKPSDEEKLSEERMPSNIQTPSNGGSSFRGVMNSPQGLFLCSYMDYFNGTYTLHCPMYSKCANMTITLLHVDFLQYRGITRRLDKVLLDEHVCTSNSVHSILPEKFWFQRDSGTWQWNNKLGNFPLSNEELCGAVASLGRIYMIGSSHMEFQHQYLQQTCAGSVKNISKQLTFKRARYTEDLIGVIHSLTKHSRSNTSNTPHQPFQTKRSS